MGEGSGTAFSSPVGDSDSPPQTGADTLSFKTPGPIQAIGEASGKSPLRVVYKTEFPRPSSTSGNTGISLLGIERTGTEVASSAVTTPLEDTGVRTHPPSFSTTAELPELFEEFGQLETRLKSSKRSSEPSGFQE
ncbi:hypothetical protein ACFX14_018848 [Malus domestica]